MISYRWAQGLLSTLVAAILIFGVVGMIGMNNVAASTGTFTQGFWRGQDPRCSFDPKTGYYYYVEDTASGIVMFRSKSLIARGSAEERRVMPAGFPLHAPVFVESMNGVTYNKWYAFGVGTWECTGDPFTGTWKLIGSYAVKGWTLDHLAFKVESGEHAGEWYLIWAAGEDLSNTTSFSAENLHISKFITPTQLESNASNLNDMLLRCSKGATWTGWDVEAPSVAQKNGTITVLYSGTDCKSSSYAIGMLVYNGGDLTNQSNWTDLNVMTPAFSNTSYGSYGTPYGTGVAAVIPSADGTETWMYYNAKLYHDIPSTYSGNREAWTRIINLKKITWTTMTLNGKTAYVPDLGSPDKMGSTVILPSGDPGVLSNGSYLFEAEHAVPFGTIFNRELQSKSGDDGEPLNLMFESPRGKSMSLNGCMKHFDWFAEGAEGDGTSGLHFRNVPESKSMVIRAGTNDPNGGFDILVNGTYKASVTFKQNLRSDGSPDSSYIFNDYPINVDIPAGATVTLLYTKGKYDDAAVDYILFEKTAQTGDNTTTTEKDVPTTGNGQGDGTTPAPTVAPTTSNNVTGSTTVQATVTQSTVADHTNGPDDVTVPATESNNPVETNGEETVSPTEDVTTVTEAPSVDADVTTVPSGENTYGSSGDVGLTVALIAVGAGVLAMGAYLLMQIKKSKKSDIT